MEEGMLAAFRRAIYRTSCSCNSYTGPQDVVSPFSHLPRAVGEPSESGGFRRGMRSRIYFGFETEGQAPP